MADFIYKTNKLAFPVKVMNQFTKDRTSKLTSCQ